MKHGRDFSFEITEQLAVLSKHSSYSTEFNRVKYRDYPAKLDLRKWHEGNPLKGITLTDEEAKTLRDALNRLFA